MAIEVFHGASIPRELSSAAMEFLWAKWKTLSATNDLTLQRLTEESTHTLRDNSSFMMSVGQDPANLDFVHMYVGHNIQHALGYNPTGRLLSVPETMEFWRVRHGCSPAGGERFSSHSASHRHRALEALGPGRSRW
jgi:hypothetical protein